MTNALLDHFRCAAYWWGRYIHYRGQSACRQCGASIQLCHSGKIAKGYGLPCCHRCDHARDGVARLEGAALGNFMFSALALSDAIEGNGAE